MLWLQILWSELHYQGAFIAKNLKYKVLQQPDDFLKLHNNLPDNAQINVQIGQIHDMQ